MGTKSKNWTLAVVSLLWPLIDFDNFIYRAADPTTRDMTLGAICILLGILTRAWAAVMAVEMAVAIVAVKIAGHQNFELEALLLAGAVTLVALGDGPLSIAVRFKQPSS